MTSRAMSRSSARPDPGAEYTAYCLRTLLETYPEISGFVADISNVGEAAAQFVQQAILEVMDAARPDAAIYLRGFDAEPAELAGKIHRRGNRPIHYVAPYTHRHLVGAGGDNAYKQWQETVGPELLMAEMDFCNFEPGPASRMTPSKTSSTISKTPIPTVL